jgi:2-polyprenyl-6-hydroxyphenyl methylase/3-demethylubiquinone-9 3-methyltransferase
MSHGFDCEEMFSARPQSGYAQGYAIRRRLVIELAQSVAGRGATVLDIGAAQGNFSLAFAERGFDVTWNDLRGELAGYVALKHETGKIAYAPGNIFKLEFAHTFDLVLMTEVIEHVAHPDLFLARAAAFLRPGGHIVLTTPNGQFVRNRLPKFSDCPDPSVFESEQFKPDGDGHIFLLYENELRDMAEAAGLQVADFRFFANPFTSGRFKSEWLVSRMPQALVRAGEVIGRMLPVALQRRLHTQFVAVLRKPSG